jgi:serine/threonine-protein kinase
MIRKSIGKYRIVEKQDRETGTVYRAVDDAISREVAIKILSADVEDSDVFRRFSADAAVLATLNHHEVAAIYEVTRVDRDLLIVMELVRGESLEQLLKRSGPLPPERAGYLVWQVLGALSPAHEAGIVHGDIRPSNLMVFAGSMKILDFGLARFADAGRPTTDSSLTATPVYMAPEQVRSEGVDHRADLYSCGVVFYNLLTGTVPFKAGNRVELMRMVLNDPPTPASTYHPDLPDWCGKLIDKALAKAPVDRFQTAEEFRSALTTAIGSATGTPARKLGTPAVFEGAPTVVMRASGAPNAVAPPVDAAVPPPPIAPIPAATPAQRAPIAKASNRNHLVAAAVVLAVFIAAVAAYNFSSRLPAADVAPVASDPVTTSPAAAPTTPAPAPVIAAPAETTPAVPANAATTPASPPATVATPQPDLASGAAPRTAKSPPAVAPPAKSTPAFPSLMFDADAVVADGDRHRERDGRLVMADGKITVVEKNDTVIATFPIDRITGVSYSTARHPLWNSPTGPAEVLRVEGGAFGIRRGARNWLVFHTTDSVHVVRVSDEDIRNVIDALQARIGQPVRRVTEKKD